MVMRLSPCGESGLKWEVLCGVRHGYASLPMRGEWIEIYLARNAACVLCLSPCGESGLKCHYKPHEQPFRPSLPMRGEWIEIIKSVKAYALTVSLPMRGEWIEIEHCGQDDRQQPVSPHAGRVD